MSSKLELKKFGRFKDLSWFQKLSESRIFIGGAGGIGSWLTLFLARAGAEITVLDADHVDETNLAGQCYGPKEVGKSKVTALATVVENLCDASITPLEVRIEDEEQAQWIDLMQSSDVVCVTFDNIATRKKVFEKWLKNPLGKANLFVDCRMGAENGEVFTVQWEDVEMIEYYKSSFFDDSEVEDAPCTAKATSHCGAMIATLAVSFITNWASNFTSVIKRDVTPHYEFHIPFTIFRRREIKVKEQHATEEVPEFCE